MAENDVAPEMLENVLRIFREKVNNNRTIKIISKKIELGTANMEDAAEYAKEIGESLANAFSSINAADLPDGRMYYNIANRVIRIPLEEADALVKKATIQIMEAMNQKAGIGLKVVE